MHRLELENLRESEPQQREHLDSVVATETVLPAPAPPCLDGARGRVRCSTTEPAGFRRQLQRGDVDSSRAHAAHAPVSTRCARSMCRDLLLGHQTTRAGGSFTTTTTMLVPRGTLAPVKASLLFNRLRAPRALASNLAFPHDLQWEHIIYYQEESTNFQRTRCILTEHILTNNVLLTSTRFTDRHSFYWNLYSTEGNGRWHLSVD